MTLPRIAHALAALVFAVVAAGSAQAAAPSFPALTGRVVDAADILPDQTEAALTARLAALEAQTRRQLVVVTVPSLQDYPIEDYGYQLGRAWGIGQKGQDNGVIFLVAPADRQVRIEVGYGLEPVLTDALSNVILQRAVLPKFRSGDIPGGVVAGTDAIIQQLALPDEEAKANVAAATAQTEEEGGAPLSTLIVLVIVVLILSRVFGGGWLLPMLLLGGRGGGGGWSSGGGGGGFGGGGGSFGGGGSSGRW